MPTVAPEKRVFCLKLSESLDVLSIFTIKLRTSSQVDVSVICSWTFIRTDFSWIVLSRHIMSTSSEVIEKPSHSLNSCMIVCVVAD